VAKTVFDVMTRTNAKIHPDEVALVNVVRRLKRNLFTPAGYGEATIRIKFAGHFMEFITTTLDERMKVDRRAPSFIAEVTDVAQSEEEEVQAGGPQGHDGA